jgi:hypothetical protein
MSVSTISALERTKFVDEMKEDFERNESLLKKCCRSDGLMAGATIKWDVVGLSDEAQTRTRNGDIPEGELALSQVTATAKEHFMKYRLDSFDAFRTNPNVRGQQYKKVVAATNRAIDKEIITQLDTATTALNSGNAVAFSALATFLEWTSSLWANDVPNDGRVWGVLTPKAYAQMLRINEFKSSDFITVRPMENGIPAMGFRRWLDVNWITHTGLTGVGTATASCYIFHESALGHQIAGDPEVHAYYYEPQDRSEVWAKVWHAAKLCLNRGIVKAVHNDTAAFS